MRHLFFVFIGGMILSLFFSCKKDSEKPPAPPRPPIDFTVSSSWECDIDGTHYTGTIDSSFLKFSGSATIIDTILFCTGTSIDKNANIQFELWINRTGWGHDSIQITTGGNRFTFDTCGKNYWICGNNEGSLIFKIDGFTGTKIKGRFYGAVRNFTGSGALDLNVTNGQISFDLGSGKNELKNFTCIVDNTNFGGYVKYARQISNTLIFDGFSFTGDSIFQMMIRTGSNLKAGTFQSRKGEVGFRIWRPSFYPFFVNDTLGNLSVTIDAVYGNVVEGRFSGTSQQGAPYPEKQVSDGKFRCRVKYYQAQQDSISKWGFSENNGSTLYNIYGGNVFNGIKHQNGSRYLLTINGESDNSLSNFKIVLRSTSPISTGLYQNGSSTNLIDSFYFRSPLVNYFTEDFRSGAYCQIDSLDNEKVVGRIYGSISLRLSPFATTPADVLKSFFRAKF